MSAENQGPPDEKKLIESLLDEMNRGCEVLELVAENCTASRSVVAKRLARDLRTEFTH